MQKTSHLDVEISKSNRLALSVVIPSHNPEALFFIEIGKLLSDRPDWQVVVVDDGSDLSLKELLPAATNLTVLRNETPQGAGTSRNIGLQVIKGDYTVFLDDDDFMDWAIIEQLIQKMDAAPEVDMAVSSYRFLSDGKLAPAHDKDLKILHQVLQGQICRIVTLENNELLLQLTNYPWNKIYRSEFIRRIGLRFSGTAVQNDVYAHWQSLLTASLILITNLVQCTQCITTLGSRISNTWDSRRLQAFTALRETYALVQRHPLPRVETAFWAFYHELVNWMIQCAGGEIRMRLIHEHVRFVGIAPRNMIALESDTEIKPWSLWDMSCTEDRTITADDANITSRESAHLHTSLTEISRLNRLSAELRGDNQRLRRQLEQAHHDSNLRIKEAQEEIFEQRRLLNTKAVRWALALRRVVKKFFPGRRGA